MTAIRESIRYMEDNLMTVSGPKEIAAHVNMSEIYLQRGFQVVTGMTLGEYVRNRRLYMAAMDLVGTDDKVIDIALRYGYDTPESFTKAFGRFHDATPTQIRRMEKISKTFLPMRVTMTVQGGSEMEVVIEKHDAFRVVGNTWDMPFEEHLDKIPKILEDYEHRNGHMCGLDAFRTSDKKEGWVRYMIADICSGDEEVPKGMEVWGIPASEWAKFYCEGPLDSTVETIKKFMWYEWLPGNAEYEIGGDCSMTKYCTTRPSTAMDYNCELWIPVRKRK